MRCEILFQEDLFRVINYLFFFLLPQCYTCKCHTSPIIDIATLISDVPFFISLEAELRVDELRSKLIIPPNMLNKQGRVSDK